jgi:MoxR-like ATPase
MTKITVLDPAIKHVRRPADTYVDIHGHKAFCKKLILHNGQLRAGRRNNFLFMGPPGTGKSLLAETLVSELQDELNAKIPYFVLDASEDTREHHLKGGYVMAGDVTPFVLGVIAAAVHSANKFGVSVINIEEITALSPGTQKILNGLLDHRRAVDIPEANLHIKLDEHAHLIFLSSMNPVVYGGVNALNRDLISRLSPRLQFDFPDSESEIRLLHSLTGEKKGLILSLVRIAQLSRITTMDYQITTRDLRDTIEIFQATGDMPQALRSLINPFSGSEDEYGTMIDRAQACFGVDIKRKKLEYENEVQVYKV